METETSHIVHQKSIPYGWRKRALSWLFLAGMAAVSMTPQLSIAAEIDGFTMECRIVSMVKINGTFELFHVESPTFTFFPKFKSYVKFSDTERESIEQMAMDSEHITIIDRKYDKNTKISDMSISQKIDLKTGTFHGKFQDKDGGIVDTQQGLCTERLLRMPSDSTMKRVTR